MNLYSREYFRLMRERLAEGGIASYWLPVLHLDPREAFAVTRGFCDVFEDCSLWTGFGHEWMLVGTRGARGPVSGERFARQWSDPVVAPRLRAAGLDSPSQLGATFLADAGTLATLTAGVAPLVDDYPHRLDPRRRLVGSPPLRRVRPAHVHGRGTLALPGESVRPPTLAAGVGGATASPPSRPRRS